MPNTRSTGRKPRLLSEPAFGALPDAITSDPSTFAHAEGANPTTAATATRRTERRRRMAEAVKYRKRDASRAHQREAQRVERGDDGELADLVARAREANLLRSDVVAD